MTDLTALHRICPPPATPQQTTIDWNAVEAELGTRLPEDYKKLATAYGPGAFCDYITLFHPNANTPWVNLTGPMPSRIRAQLQHDYDRGTHPVPYEPHNLFTLGVTSNGEYLFWITDPENTPAGWRIAVNEARGPRWYAYDGTLSEFLTSMMTGETAVPQFPKDLLDLPITSCTRVSSPGATRCLSCATRCCAPTGRSARSWTWPWRPNTGEGTEPSTLG